MKLIKKGFKSLIKNPLIFVDEKKTYYQTSL